MKQLKDKQIKKAFFYLGKEIKNNRNLNENTVLFVASEINKLLNNFNKRLAELEVKINGKK